MFFVLSKVIYWMVMPTSLIAWAMLASLLVKRKKYKSVLNLISIGLFLFFTNPFLASLLIHAWEDHAVPYDEIKGKYTYGVVLSGITNPDRPPFDRIQFNKGADRMVHTIDLYRKGIISKIIITGGSGRLINESRKESHALRDFAIENGIPEIDIIVEEEARNTHENATNTAALIKNSTQEVILITSAFHMYRAQKCFEKIGLETFPFPTDHYSTPMNYTPDEIIIPNLGSLNIWTILTKEWIGIIAYKVSGYI